MHCTFHGAQYLLALLHDCRQLPLTLKPASFYNIEKHVNRTLILNVNHACCVDIADCGLIAYQRIQAPFTHKMKAYKISFLLI